MKRWGFLFACIVVVAFGCKDEKSSDSDKNTNIPNNNTDSATGAFCHGLTLDGETTDFALRVGEGSDMVTLSASTGECSTGLGQTCRTIPAGTGIPLELVDESGESVFTASADITKDLEYVFYLELDEDDNLSLMGGDLTAAATCSDMECELMYYNTQTCGADDPCGWAGDGFCDDMCGEVVSSPFDDSEDCGDCSDITDYTTCVTCDCAEPMSVCLANADCVTLLDCVADCTDDACVTTCAEATPAGVVDLTGLLDCADTNCAEYL